MFDRFWQQYPQGSIVSDLVQIHGEHYVVKVSLSSAQQVLVTTLAADLDLVVAEQRATNKALEILGISGRQESPATAENKSSDTEYPDAKATIEIDNQPAFITSESEPAIDVPNGNGKTAAPDVIELPITTESQAITEVAIPELATKSSKAKKATVEPTPTMIMEVIPEVIPEPTVQPQPAAAENLEQNPALKASPETPPETPLSVTDMIPLINMELKRLGWSKERGRDYMVSLYNKRASALLSDEELFGLLQHLKAEQVVPSGS